MLGAQHQCLGNTWVPGGFLLAVPPERVRSWPWSQRGLQFSQLHPKAVKDFFTRGSVFVDFRLKWEH